MNKKLIAVVGGNGKLGSKIAQFLQNEGFLTEIFDKNTKNLENCGALFDFVVDASEHSSSLLTAKFCAQKKMPLLICCTGHTQGELLEIERLKNQTHIEICYNLSSGINLILNLIDSVSHVKQISIFERHHSRKKDAPSGTALLLKNSCVKLTDNVEVLSSRFGENLGYHSVELLFDGEIVTISHRVTNYDVFAHGAVKKIKDYLENI
ncbi:MAG: hypothetical protein IJ542_00375 [Clostridia bacterium]|nr:hypothetical protein [Clostridia bacterium]